MSSPTLLLVVLVLYTNAFIYVFKKHTKYFGFILMILSFILSLIYAGNYNSQILQGIGLITFNIPFILLLLFAVVFLHFYNLTKVLSAYSNRSDKRKSFDLKLNDEYAKYLNIFTISFIIGICLLYLFVFLFTIQNQNLKIMGTMFAFLVAAIATETIHAVKFAKIKG